ncbi:11017_t:CDS:2, partial [Paraglomus brasilianum]
QHRTKNQDSKQFWDKTEDELLHEKRMREKNRDMELAELGAACGVMQRIAQGLKKRSHDTICNDVSGEESPTRKRCLAEKEKELMNEMLSTGAFRGKCV